MNTLGRVLVAFVLTVAAVGAVAVNPLMAFAFGFGWDWVLLLVLPVLSLAGFYSARVALLGLAVVVVIHSTVDGEPFLGVVDSVGLHAFAQQQFFNSLLIGFVIVASLSIALGWSLGSQRRRWRQDQYTTTLSPTATSSNNHATLS